MTHNFTVEESRALLLAIFPKYPDLRGCQPPPPDLKKFLENLHNLRAPESKAKP